jgi:hypothetical protein
MTRRTVNSVEANFHVQISGIRIPRTQSTLPGLPGLDRLLTINGLTAWIGRKK